MAPDLNQVVQREFQYCVIDEVDSILIDEADTTYNPGQVDRPQEKYRRAFEVADKLIRCAELSKDGVEADGDYEVDEKQRSCVLTDQGFVKSENFIGTKDLFDPNDPWAHFITNALKAKELFIKDVNYIVRQGEAVIVDEFTGRVMPGRRWSDGQHQAIEAKEGLDIQPETQTLASITYQNYFLLYPRLAGMTGTAKTEEVEFEKTYKLETTIIPTNRPRSRQDWPDQVYKTEEAKWRAVAREIVDINKSGRPILVGTTSVEKSELLSSLLQETHTEHNLLNAKPEYVERESEIVAQAGRPGAVTIATNMAGRGTDILLGGNSDYMARLKVREFLIGRLVRPEDLSNKTLPQQNDDVQGFAAENPSNKPHNATSARNLYPCELSESTVKSLVQLLQTLVKTWGDQTLSLIDLEERIANAAEKAPTSDSAILALRSAIHSVKDEFDKVVDRDEAIVRSAGGLHVIGTERHESRRVDNQLRGRAGRQGDPGSILPFFR